MSKELTILLLIFHLLKHVAHRLGFLDIEAMAKLEEQISIITKNKQKKP